MEPSLSNIKDARAGNTILFLSVRPLNRKGEKRYFTESFILFNGDISIFESDTGLPGIFVQLGQRAGKEK
jgi:hypothetical protein